MRIVNIHEAKTQLSKLVDLAAKGEPFIIAKVGKPLVKVTPLEAAAKAKVQRLGFMAGQGQIPEDFDQMGETEIGRLFTGDEAATRYADHSMGRSVARSPLKKGQSGPGR